MARRAAGYFRRGPCFAEGSASRPLEAPRYRAYPCGVRERAELPSGTVTFLFTDIEGSTRLLHELGERYSEVLGEHRRVIREAVQRHDGVEVDTQGDAFFFAFARASDAVAGAQEAQATLQGGPVRVRMGLHTGEPIRGEEGYVGIDVHRGARVAAAGHGGQVLLSQPTRDLLDSSFDLVDLGLHRLKDLSEPQRLYQVGSEQFPPLKTLHQTNLPVPASPFLGRERELAEVLGLLRSSRLLTLTGPGGSGKTRLAAQAAAEVAENFPGGVWWVSLAALTDSALVLESIAQVLGAKGELAEHIADNELLLLLDNLEQLLAAAPVLAVLLERCSGLKLLVTSREPLRLTAEQEYPVPPFVSEEAVGFFSARARAARPDFQADEAVAEVCRRLDNLPLALELAAARVKVLSPEQILARLEQALQLLTGGRSDAPERQRTLAATITWSYDLLAEPEQRLFARLSVFAGGCTLEAAEQVCDADLETLASLVDKNLLRHSGERFWMLETIREYALERLSESADFYDLLHQRHAVYYGDLAATTAEALRSYDEQAVAVVDAELPNLRAGLQAAIDSQDAALLARYLFGLWFYWLIRGLGREGSIAAHAWLEMDRAAITPRERLLGLLGAGETLRHTGAADLAVELKLEALSLARSDPSADMHGHTAGSRIPSTLADLAHLHLDAGRLDDARSCAEEALAIRRESGDAGGIAHALFTLLHLEEVRGDFRKARELALEVTEWFETAGEPIEAAAPLAKVAEFDALLGEKHRAAKTLAAAASAASASPDLQLQAWVVRVGAVLAHAWGESERAAMLFAVLDRIGEESAVEVANRAELERDRLTIERLRGLLGAEAFERAQGQGRDASVAAHLQDLASWLGAKVSDGAEATNVNPAEPQRR